MLRPLKRFIHLAQKRESASAQVVGPLVIGIFFEDFLRPFHSDTRVFQCVILVTDFFIGRGSKQGTFVVFKVAPGRRRITTSRSFQITLMELGSSQVLISNSQSRIQFNGLFKSDFCVDEVTLGCQCICIRQVSFGGIRSELHQLVGGFSGRLLPLFTVFISVENSLDPAHFCEIKPGANESRILIAGFLEHFGAQFGLTGILRHCVAASAQEIFVRLCVTRFSAHATSWAQFEFQHLKNARSDIVLDGKNIVEFAIVSLRPQVRVRVRLDQLCRYANSIAGFA